MVCSCGVGCRIWIKKVFYTGEYPTELGVVMSSAGGAYGDTAGLSTEPVELFAVFKKFMVTPVALPVPSEVFALLEKPVAYALNDEQKQEVATWWLHRIVSNPIGLDICGIVRNLRDHFGVPLEQLSSSVDQVVLSLNESVDEIVDMRQRIHTFVLEEESGIEGGSFFPVGLDPSSDNSGQTWMGYSDFSDSSGGGTEMDAPTAKTSQSKNSR